MVLVVATATASCGVVNGEPGPDPAGAAAVDAALAIENYEWTMVADDAPWGRRAGLRVVELNGDLFLMGGRTPRQSEIPGDSDIWGDVWKSSDHGKTWSVVLEHDEAMAWPARAYFQAVVKDDQIVVLGGQKYGLEPNPFCALLEKGLKPPPNLEIDPDAPCPEFLPTSDFFSDVWASPDGTTWEQLTASAAWDGRAGLSAAVFDGDIYVMAGSTNDDSSIVGPGGPVRLYYNDVWRSSDGVDWELVTDAAPWEPRAGAAVAVHDDALWLFGGERGFTCEPLPDCDLPYFNDVWRTTDGETWEQVSEGAGWGKRPGHQCEIVGSGIFCFGGFGPVTNPMDQWISVDGAAWHQHRGAPWNATDSEQIKYDFEAVTVFEDGAPVVLTFGGDRETFDFGDPDNYLRADADIWRFGP
jgi:hypothetical protein